METAGPVSSTIFPVTLDTAAAAGTTETPAVVETAVSRSAAGLSGPGMLGTTARSQVVSQSGSLIYPASPTPTLDWGRVGSMGAIPQTLGPSIPAATILPEAPATVVSPAGSMHALPTPASQQRFSRDNVFPAADHLMPVARPLSPANSPRQAQVLQATPREQPPLDVQALRAEHALVCHLQQQLDHRLATLERITEGATLRELDRGPGHQADLSDGTFKHDFLMKPLHGYYVQRNQVQRRENQLVLLDGDRHSVPPQVMWLAGMA